MLIRSTAQLVVIVIASVVGVLMYLLAAFHAPTPLAVSVVVIFGLLWVVACTRAIRAGILLSSDGLVVRNITRSYTFPRTAVARFSIERWHFLPFCCMVELRNGERVPAIALGEVQPDAVGPSGRRRHLGD